MDKFTKILKVRLSTIINIFFFFCLNPNISPFPIHTDVQPPAFILAFFLFLYIGVKYKYRFDFMDVLFIFFGLLNIFYFNPDKSTFVFQKRLAILAAFFVYYLVKYFHPMFNFRVYYFSVVFNFVAALLHYFMPSVFISFARHFVRTIKITNPQYGVRGASGFFPEPGFLGAIAVFYLIFLFYFLKLRSYKVPKFNMISIFLMCISMIILSKSGTGFLYFFIFLFCLWIYFSFRKPIFSLLLTALLILSVYFLFSYNILSGRGVSVIKSLLSGNFSLFFVDTSIVQRIANFVTGILAMLSNPFGFGAGNFPEAARLVASKFNLYNIFYTLSFSKFLDSVSSIGLYLVELGLPFLGFLLILFLHVDRKYFSFIAYFYAFLFLSFSFSFAFPPTWLLIGCFSKYSGSVVSFFFRTR